MNDDLAKRLIFEEDTEEERVRYCGIVYDKLYGIAKNENKYFSVFRDVEEDKFYKIYFTSNYDRGYSFDKWEQVIPIYITETKWERAY